MAAQAALKLGDSVHSGHYIIIGSEIYNHNYDPYRPDRYWSPEALKIQAAKIGEACRGQGLSLRVVCGESVGHQGFWVGDDLRMIAQGLSKGRISQGSGDGDLKPLKDGSGLAPVDGPGCLSSQTTEGWRRIFVAYVYSEKEPSERLGKQAAKNPERTLYGANRLHPGQYVGLKENVDGPLVVVGDDLEAVVHFIKGTEGVLQL